MKTDRLSKSDFSVKTGEDLDYLPKGYTLLVGSDDDEAFARELIMNKDVILLFISFSPGLDWSNIHDELWRLVQTKSLTPIFFSRNACSSGLNSERTRSILMESTVFRPFIKELYNAFTVRSLWVLGNKSGDHPYHKDRFSYGSSRRNLASLGCDDKIMWFHCFETNRKFGITIPHAALVSINKHAAGVTSNIKHCVAGAAHSWLIAFET